MGRRCGFQDYIFAGGPNPPGTGGNGDLYDYGAPISLAGDERPHLAALAGYHTFLARESWLAEAECQVDCRIVADLEQGRAWAGQRSELLANSGEAMDWALKGLFTTASCAGWSPEFIDPLAGGLPIDLPLLVPSTSAMRRRLQVLLADAVRRRARVLITPVLPDRDEDFQPCTIFAEAVGGWNPTPAGTALAAGRGLWHRQHSELRGALFLPGAGWRRRRRPRDDQRGGHRLAADPAGWRPRAALGPSAEARQGRAHSGVQGHARQPGRHSRTGDR